MTDIQQIIKAAVKAIEDVIEHVDPVGRIHKETLFNAFNYSRIEFVELNSLKDYLEENLKFHLEALKGLTDDSKK